MITLKLLFALAAIVCFLIRGLGFNTGRIDFQNIGFAFVVAFLIA